MNYRQLALRLLGRAYLPMAARVLMWVIVTAAIGHADAVRLLTAMVFMRSARTFATVDTRFAIRQRLGAAQAVYRKTVRRVMRIEAGSFALSVTILAIIVWILVAIGQTKIAELTAILGLALPVRHLAPFGGNRPEGLYGAAASFYGPPLVAIVFAAGLGLWWLAIAVAAREWLALATVMLARRFGAPAPIIRDEPVTFAEVAAFTAVRAKNRFAYRVVRSVLRHLPGGAVVARTGHTMGVHRRLAPWTGRSAYPIVAIAVGTLAGAIAVPILLAKPATMLISATLLRVAATAGNVLLWWRFANDQLANEQEDDEEDD